MTPSAETLSMSRPLFRTPLYKTLQDNEGQLNKNPSRAIAILVMKACATCAIIGMHIDDDRYQFTKHNNKRKQANTSELSTIIGNCIA
jgi:hypothetical protein